ncbi:hypothetical protein Aduo_018345 [Ancylostoma duodenale]
MPTGSASERPWVFMEALRFLETARVEWKGLRKTSFLFTGKRESEISAPASPSVAVVEPIEPAVGSSAAVVDPSQLAGTYLKDLAESEASAKMKITFEVLTAFVDVGCAVQVVRIEEPDPA